MGLFNKLKNALFEEEEIDFDSTPDKVVIKDEETPVVKEVPKQKKEELPVENERELFKVENTFNFPDFDEEEFVTNYEPQEEVIKKPKKEEEKEVYSRRTTRENNSKISNNRRKVEKRVTREEPERKVFKPSPVISPVYGILDKNYKKEDLMPSNNKPKENKIVDVDMARKKAFGTLEEDIEESITKQKAEDFYNNDNKSIDDLLNETIDDTIELKYDGEFEREDFYDDPNESIENIDSVEELTNSIEEELDDIDNNLEEIEPKHIEKPKKKKKEKKEIKEKEETKEYLEEDTLESDLFDLIDSMYDNREEE